MANADNVLQGVTILGKVDETHRKILTPQALTFLALLHRSFNAQRKSLLERRKLRQAELDRGVLPDFLPETKHIRDNATWKGAPPAPGLVDRRVEITGPTDRKMVVNALNSDVWTYMADFEGEFPFLLTTAATCCFFFWPPCLSLCSSHCLLKTGIARSFIIFCLVLLSSLVVSLIPLLSCTSLGLGSCLLGPVLVTSERVGRGVAQTAASQPSL